MTKAVTLGDVARAAGGRLTGEASTAVIDVTHDSRQVREGWLFVAVRGAKLDAHRFIPDVMRAGAAGVVSEAERPEGFSGGWIQAADARRALALAAAEVHRHPSRELSLVGITGTNGKTTTAYLVAALAEAAGERTALVSTVEYRVAGERLPALHTTPEASDVQRLLRRAADLDCRVAVMESSSQALDLRRCDALSYTVAAFTNLTRDHLDYHGTMDAYFAAKRKLFDEPGPAAVNVDDEYGRRLASELGEVTTFGIEHEADYRARDVRFDVSGARFTCETPDGPVELESPLPGLFNVQNVLGAVVVARILGVEAGTVAEALRSVGRVPGRFEPVEEGQDFGVLVDYAHTPDSLENVLRAARGITRNRLHVVFGAGGDRDRGKRPLMGRAASELADRVIVTSDNPRNEDPEAILDQVMEGTGDGAEREVDRRSAIGLAIASAEPGDVVVIAGKGHEQGQEFERGRKEPFDDVTVAREALRARYSRMARR
jgi:UDP-N-acetylmuramoyl-L-alanyl-D-glutamate--2,6-diaminopimelate ligase